MPSRQAQQAELFDQFETGHLTPAEFRAGLRAAYDLDATDAELDAAWHAMLLDVPAERLALIGELRRQGHQTALLSNTNSLHIAEINRRLATQYGFQNGIADVLDRVFYSQEVGLRKPGEEIFRHALREMNWRPPNTCCLLRTARSTLPRPAAWGCRCCTWPRPSPFVTALPEALRAFPREYAPAHS